MKLPIAVLGPKDEITYKTCGHVGKQRVIRTGKVLTVSQGQKICILVDLGKYRDTIYEHDLINGDVEILDIKKGDGRMSKSRPDKEYLRSIFEQAGGNISKAANLCEPQVSDVTMGKWLKDVDIIPKEGLRATVATPPPIDELKAAWNTEGHVIARMCRNYHVSANKMKRWLKEAAIIKETAAGIETITGNNKDAEKIIAASDMTINESAINTDRPDVTEIQPNEKENEILYKTIKFYLAPIEESLNMLEKRVDMHSSNNPNLNQDDILNTLADLIIKVALRL